MARLSMSMIDDDDKSVIKFQFLDRIFAQPRYHRDEVFDHRYRVQLCPAHNCSLVNEWFNCCNALHGINCKLIRLPAYSPDINIIENIWGIAKYSMLYSKCVVKTREELAELVESEWAKLSADLSLCTNLVDSIDGRLDSIIRANGYSIKY